MFEDQLHQLLAAAAELPPQQPPAQISYVPLSFSLLHNASSSPPFPLIFDNYPSPQPPPHHHHQHHNQMMQHSTELQYQEAEPIPVKPVGEQGQNPQLLPWSHDELVALFSLRSAMDNCFPDFTWDHVSRKLEEIGFTRSPQKCKEKFEEESRSYVQTATTNTTITINADEATSCPTKNYRQFSELEEFYHHGCEEVLDGEEKEEDEHQGQNGFLDENDGSEATDYHRQITIDEVKEDAEVENKNAKSSHHHNKKKFKVFKSFCEEIVNKMMAHQEELHNKILQEFIERDKENIAMEEAWKKQEMVRINKEMEARDKDRAMIGDRQAKIIEFLHKFISGSNTNSSKDTMIINNNGDESLSQTSNSITAHIDPISPTSKYNKMGPISQKSRPKRRAYEDDDIGRKWPREEVTALINIRCNLNSTNNTSPDIACNESSKNPPLWERISRSMKELGYHRSARRCKEKWENINKYFRKTKDSKKKRPTDSRTCPYFQQLNHLYSIGRTSVGSDSISGFSNTGDDATFQPELNGIYVEN